MFLLLNLLYNISGKEWRYGGLVLDKNPKNGELQVVDYIFAKDNKNVFYKNENITGLTPDKITKKGIARTFQNIRLFKNLTVLENILIANHLRINSNFLSSTLRMPWSKKEERQMREKSEMLLDKLDLLRLKNEIAHSLPYGEQRKLEIRGNRL